MTSLVRHLSPETVLRRALGFPCKVEECSPACPHSRGASGSRPDGKHRTEAQKVVEIQSPCKRALLAAVLRSLEKAEERPPHQAGFFCGRLAVLPLARFIGKLGAPAKERQLALHFCGAFFFSEEP